MQIARSALGGGAEFLSLERFQQKWTPLLRFENATKQRFRAFVLMRSKHETLWK
jgi:hypothetical protein